MVTSTSGCARTLCSHAGWRGDPAFDATRRIVSPVFRREERHRALDAVIETARERDGFTDVAARGVPAPPRLPSTAEFVRFARESFGPLPRAETRQEPMS
jgi:hypothetical protein